MRSRVAKRNAQFCAALQICRCRQICCACRSEKIELKFIVSAMRRDAWHIQDLGGVSFVTQGSAAQDHTDAEYLSNIDNLRVQAAISLVRVLDVSLCSMFLSCSIWRISCLRARCVHSLMYCLLYLYTNAAVVFSCISYTFECAHTVNKKQQKENNTVNRRRSLRPVIW